jgi:hypothetical protein
LILIDLGKPPNRLVECALVECLRVDEMRLETCSSGDFGSNGCDGKRTSSKLDPIVALRHEPNERNRSRAVGSDRDGA